MNFIYALLILITVTVTNAAEKSFKVKDITGNEVEVTWTELQKSYQSALFEKIKQLPLSFHKVYENGDGSITLDFPTFKMKDRQLAINSSSYDIENFICSSLGKKYVTESSKLTEEGNVVRLKVENNQLLFSYVFKGCKDGQCSYLSDITCR